ncbi:MAG TPA: tetratricopeptide repeat protein [Vulgatibacter sp.]|nr:tetratricopeptide repeat protein [Vulgatibacter sp.]
MSFDRAQATRHALAGNDAYAAGDWGGAISAYEAALQAGADSADLWFNLGNACYRAGQTGRAALAFEKALRRDPGDEQALRNLELVRSQVTRGVVGAQRPPFLDRVGARVDLEVASASLLATWILAFCVLALRLRLRGAALRAVAAGMAAVLLAGSAVAGAATWAATRVRAAGWAVVLTPGEVREAPQPDARVAFPIEATVAVRLTATVGRYVRVELPGGLSGWIEAAAVAPIDP